MIPLGKAGSVTVPVQPGETLTVWFAMHVVERSALAQVAALAAVLGFGAGVLVGAALVALAVLR